MVIVPAYVYIVTGLHVRVQCTFEWERAWPRISTMNFQPINSLEVWYITQQIHLKPKAFNNITVRRILGCKRKSLLSFQL